VIHEVDESLRGLIKRDVVNDGEIDVVFDAPTREWSSKRSTPTVDLFLYDIREELSQRQQGLVRERGADGRVVSQRDPTRRLKLSYLLTAWAQRPEDEHRLLAAMLECLLRYDALPDEVLTEALSEAGTTVGITVGLPSVEDRHVSDLWTAIGGDLRPALDVVATAPVQSGIVRPPGPIVLERTKLTMRRPAGTEVAGAASARADPSAGETGDRAPAEQFSAGERGDDFDAPTPVNDLPRGRTFRMHSHRPRQ
jgi:hypothetical protein